ncbi:MAG TPA: MlaD family protein [Pelomicrobium sp.]|nr:MlaD family protein [Pelomicrobium sp.]
MEAQARYVLVGTVIIILCAALVVFVLWLNRTGLQRDTDPYLIFFRQQSLDGLQVNSDVKMRGIKVGFVVNFAIVPEDVTTVRVLVRLDEGTPVRASTEATIVRNLVTGLAQIHLVNTDPNSPPLTKAPEGLPHPVIGEARSGYDEFTDALGRFAEEGVQTLERIQLVLTDDNIARLRGTLANLENLTLKLEQQTGKMAQTLTAVTRAADDFRTLTATLNRTATRMDANFATLSQETVRTLTTSREAVEALRGDLTAMAASIERLSGSGDQELRATARELRAAADSLARTARRLEDPSAALFGPHPGELGPGEAQ